MGLNARQSSCWSWPTGHGCCVDERCLGVLQDARRVRKAVPVVSPRDRKLRDGMPVGQNTLRPGVFACEPAQPEPGELVFSSRRTISIYDRASDHATRRAPAARWLPVRGAQARWVSVAGLLVTRGATPRALDGAKSVANLLRQVVLFSDLAQESELRFEPLDMLFLAGQDRFE